MTTRMRPLAIAALVSLIAALLAAAPLSQRADAATTFTQATEQRIDGADAVATAIALSAASYESSDTVVIARVDDYADGLTGSVLAAQLSAPILFTTTDALSAGVADEAARLGADEAVILGGNAAVSDGVEAELVAAGLTTRRVAGDNRFTTALAVADEVLGEDTPDIVYFVEGEHADPTRGWPDAINAAAIAAASGQPILLVNAEFVPESIQAAWDAYAADGAAGIIVGGPLAVTEDTEAALVGEGPEVGRLAGDTRFATSSAVYAFAVSELSLDPSVRYVIPGSSFAEGLAAGAVAGARSNPTVMVDSVDIANSPPALELLGTNLDTLDTYILVGGESVISAAVADALTAATTPVRPEGATCITLLHHNDGESMLLNAPVGPNFGSLARMVTLAAQERALAEASDCAPITVTSGDNFLAGAALSASDPTNTDPDGPRVLDAIGLSYVGYDALAIGNHDLDFGPEFLARFINSFEPAVPFLSANLDVSAVPSLQALADDGLIAPSITVDAGGTEVGIIGLVTPILRSISSPGAVEVLRDIVPVVQAEVDRLTAEGVDHLILISHLQDLNEDIDFVGQISGLDAVVAGGGDEVLAGPADPLVPGDLVNVAGDYPFLLPDADGAIVPTVTTAGDYKYLGRLNLFFGDDGNLLPDTPFDPQTSRMVRLADESLPFGVARDPRVVAEVEGPVRDFVADLETNVIATSEVPLDGSRPPIRTQETNLGNLVADAHRYVIETRGAEFGIDTSTTQVVGIQNGGGIRNNNVIPAGPITELNTFQILAFTNFVAAVEDFDAQSLKDVLETAYASLPGENGSFSQVSNLIIEIDTTFPAQETAVDDEGGVAITTPGQRIRSMTFADGTPLVVDGEVVADAPTFVLATIDFSLRNGDGYPFNLGDDGFQVVGVTYQQGLSQYLQANADGGGLQGVISAEQYPAGGEGRITITTG
ncbi:hypothetical protein BH23ACT9_BH23ACT9_22920 [soil metagenome]